MRTILIVLACVFMVFAGKKTSDTTTVINCKCDTIKVVTTYKDTSVIVKVDTLKAEKPAKKSKKVMKAKK